MSRPVPNIYVGNSVKKRDRLSFKNFVLEVIEDTFINEFEPTSASLDSDTQTFFTLFLFPIFWLLFSLYQANFIGGQDA